MTLARLLVAGCVAAAGLPLPALARAQGLFVDTGAGRSVYEAISAHVPSNNLTAALRYEGPHEAWIFGAAGAPLRSGDTLWLGGGGGARVPLGTSHRGHVAFGADVAAHGFSFRDRVTDATGAGATLEALPVLGVTIGQARAEAIAGWRGHTVTVAGIRDSRGVIETGVRAGYGDAVRLEGEARWVGAAEGTFPFAGAAIHVRPSRIGLSAGGGRWLHSDLDDVTWRLAADVTLTPNLWVWAGVRQEAPDPLYWNPARRTWSIGLTTRVRHSPTPLAQMPRLTAGQVLVRLRAADGPAGAIAIAGDFNGWTPQPMTREGDAWVVRLPLAPGVYNYAFRSAAGEWFVPSSTPGRRADGMGGHVAVLVVS